MQQDKKQELQHKLREQENQDDVEPMGGECKVLKTKRIQLYVQTSQESPWEGI